MKKNLDVFLELVEAGISVREVAKEFNVPQTTLWRWLKEEAVDRTYIKTKLITKAKLKIEKRDKKENEKKEKEIDAIMVKLQEKIREELKKELKGV